VKIFINGQALDFALEKEKTLGEVMTALQSWFSVQSIDVHSIAADGKELPVESKEAWEPLSLDGIEKIEIVASNPYVRSVEVLTFLCDFADRSLKAWESAGFEEFSRLMDSFPMVNEHLRELLPGLFGPLDKSTALEQAFSDHAAGAYDDKAFKDPRLGDFLKNLRVVLYDRLLEMVEPEEETPPILRALKIQATKIENISVLLQTGKDHNAMQTLITFTELLEKVMRLYLSLKTTSPDKVNTEIEGRSFENFMGDFNRVLGSLVEAFTAKDSVLIGDLLEYEIAPRAAALTGYFNLEIPMEENAENGPAAE
jgi:hypothetical protein